MRKTEIRKKNAREKAMPKLKISNEITCMSCKQFSGWTNDDLIYVSGNRELKCKSCKQPCINVICKKPDIHIL